MDDRDVYGVEYGAAFIIGALLGAGLTMMLTPKPTDRIKKDMRKKGKRLRKDAEKQFGQAREVGQEFWGEAEERIGSLAEEISAVVEEGVRTIRATVSDELEDIERRLSGRKKRRGIFR